jgi:hypothetical protein
MIFFSFNGNLVITLCIKNEKKYQLTLSFPVMTNGSYKKDLSTPKSKLSEFSLQG